ncbi:hypothetical protein BT69DRAFT_1329760 [Atractiella rhizophila]|nr:hypothetical protein BT69DRAFT_1329760 [Atractiella rhizophila]
MHHLLSPTLIPTSVCKLPTRANPFSLPPSFKSSASTPYYDAPTSASYYDISTPHETPDAGPTSFFEQEEKPIPLPRPPLTRKQKKKKKQDEKSGKPLNSFFLFKKHLMDGGFVEKNKAKLLTSNGQVDQARVSQVVGKIWEKMSASAKAAWAQKALEQAEKYNAACLSGGSRGFRLDDDEDLKGLNVGGGDLGQFLASEDQKGKALFRGESHGNTLIQARKRNRRASIQEETRPRKKKAIASYSMTAPDSPAFSLPSSSSLSFFSTPSTVSTVPTTFSLNSDFQPCPTTLSSSVGHFSIPSASHPHAAPAESVITDTMSQQQLSSSMSIPLTIAPTEITEKTRNQNFECRQIMDATWEQLGVANGIGIDGLETQSRSVEEEDLF